MTLSEEIIIRIETTISYLMSHGHVNSFGREALIGTQKDLIELKEELRKNGKI